MVILRVINEEETTLKRRPILIGGCYYLMKKTALTLVTAFTLSVGLFVTSSEAAEHTVKSVDKNMSENNISSAVIYRSDTLSISPVVKEVEKNQDISTYVVRPGDTLVGIAKAYDVTVDQLVTWNKIVSKDIIYVGDTLALNEASVGEAKVTHTAYPVTQNAQKSGEKISQPRTSQASGNVARTLAMEATAYTAYCEGCSGITANGTNLRANPHLKVIAVDPSVIPLGTRVWVEGYGEAIAADTGGAIKGNKIDVYLPTNNQAYAWGRKTVTVKVLN